MFDEFTKESVLVRTLFLTNIYYTIYWLMNLILLVLLTSIGVVFSYELLTYFNLVITVFLLIKFNHSIIKLFEGNHVYFNKSS